VRDGSLTTLRREQKVLREQGLKRCASCGEVKDRATGFYPHRTNGVSTYCRECDVRATVARQKADPATASARHKAWRDANPEKAQANSRKGRSARRARLREAFVEQVDPRVLYERDEGCCGFCGGQVDPASFDVDHAVPLAAGGEHSYVNTRIAHPTCNRRQGRKTALAVVA
jgi:hypothetical protein